MKEFKSFISQGYRYIRTAPGKYTAEHRLVIEKSGKRLDPKLVVHHIDGNRLNNELSNLLVCTQSQHCKLEKFGIRLRGKKQTKEHIKNWRKSRWGK